MDAGFNGINDDVARVVKKFSQPPKLMKRPSGGSAFFGSFKPTSSHIISSNPARRAAVFVPFWRDVEELTAQLKELQTKMGAQEGGVKQAIWTECAAIQAKLRQRELDMLKQMQTYLKEPSAGEGQLQIDIDKLVAEREKPAITPSSHSAASPEIEEEEKESRQPTPPRLQTENDTDMINSGFDIPSALPQSYTTWDSPTTTSPTPDRGAAKLMNDLTSFDKVYTEEDESPRALANHTSAPSALLEGSKKTFDSFESPTHQQLSEMDLLKAMMGTDSIGVSQLVPLPKPSAASIAKQ